MMFTHRRKLCVCVYHLAAGLATMEETPDTEGHGYPHQ